MIVEWEAPFVLTSPLGSLDFNVEVDGLLWLLEPKACRHSMPMRVVSDNVPQDDGEVHHRRFRGGMAVQLVLGLYEVPDGWQLGDDVQAACGSVAQQMEIGRAHV